MTKVFVLKHQKYKLDSEGFYQIEFDPPPKTFRKPPVIELDLSSDDLSESSEETVHTDTSDDERSDDNLSELSLGGLTLGDEEKIESDDSSSDDESSSDESSEFSDSVSSDESDDDSFENSDEFDDIQDLPIPSRPKESSRSYTIDPKLVELAEKGALQPELLKTLSYTELIRLATHPSASSIIEKTMGLRGVPLLEPYIVKPHQVEILEWMKKIETLPQPHGMRGGIVAATMGLGKTLMMLLNALTRPKGEFPTLAIVSKTVLIEWKSQPQDFFGTGSQAPKILYLHSGASYMGKSITGVTREFIKKFDLVVTTYDVCKSACRRGKYHEDCFEIGDAHTLMKDKIVSVHKRTDQQANRPELTGIEVIYGTPWERVIYDESQRFVNPDTETYKHMMAIYGKYVWCASATPIKNKNTDIWAQLRMVGYTGVIRKIDWRRGANRYYRDHHLEDFIFSMSQEDAGIELPPKTEIDRYYTFNSEEQTAYDFVLGKTVDIYDQLLRKAHGLNFTCVLTMFLKLRQCCLAPCLVMTKIEAKGGKKAKEVLKGLQEEISKTPFGGWMCDRSGTAGIYSTKITEIINILKKIPPGEKVTIFSTFTCFLDLLAEALEKRLPRYEFVQMDGRTSDDERAQYISSFKEDPKIKAFAMTYKTGGEGINLAKAANHCICAEPWWTDTVEEQGKGRVYRVGQTKPTYMHNIYITNSIEDKIMDIKHRKKEMAASFLEGTESKNGGLNMALVGEMLNRPRR
jgi:SNF2 family DNA or RNA helicase